MTQTGYSGRPLSRKLGLKPGMTCWRVEMPEDIADLLNAQEPGQLVMASPAPMLDCAHVFVREKTCFLSILLTSEICLRPMA